MNAKRVVITGYGLTSPLGNSAAELFQALLDNRSGIRTINDWGKIDSLRTRVAGICENIDEQRIDRQYRRTMGRVAILGALAAMDAVEHSGLDLSEVGSELCGVSFGSTEGSCQSLEDYLTHILDKKSIRGMASSTYLHIMSHTCAANIAAMFQTRGPVVASCTACVSGSQGIGFGYDAIKAGRADIMLCGGAEEMHFMDAAIFDIMRATSTKYNDRPSETPRPFDRDRDGLVVAEGSGCLVLEDYEHAKKRNAVIYAEVIGFGTNCDGFHMTRPSAEGMTGVMNMALKDAGISADSIDHINAHATATDAGDIAESFAINTLFGESVPVTAFKGYIGHTLGGCGAIESIISLLILERGVTPCTKNLENPDPECAPIQHVMKEARELKAKIVMNNNFAFGGINTSLIFTRV